jgi:hypothetical protein
MNKTLVAVLAVVVLAVVAFGGFYFGSAQGKLATEKKLAPLLNSAFPKPPDDIRFLDGIVKSVSGSTLDLEIDNIDDYIPHTDGTPRLKDVRHAIVSDKTVITLIDLGKFTSNGQPTRTAIKLSDIKPGMNATARSAVNIRNVKTFDATSIEVIQ